MIKLNVINFINTQNIIIRWGNNLLAMLKAPYKSFSRWDFLNIIGKGHPKMPTLNLVVLTQLFNKLPNEA